MRNILIIKKIRFILINHLTLKMLLSIKRKKNQILMISDSRLLLTFASGIRFL